MNATTPRRLVVPSHPEPETEKSRHESVEEGEERSGDPILSPGPASFRRPRPLYHIGPAGVHVSQQMCSHHTLFPSIIMIQLQRPYSLNLFPHQQQFQHRLRCSNGQLGSGHLGRSGLPAAAAGLPSKLGGIGYAMDCAVRLRHGLRLHEGDDDDLLLLLLPPLLLLFLSLSLPLLLLLLPPPWCFLPLSFLDDFDDSAGASAQ
jgi:hypothetical protein